jgi:hypothetical protein
MEATLLFSAKTGEGVDDESTIFCPSSCQGTSTGQFN